jgi:poly(ribitol-phosphate) beta-N-acetylglucosaminyltransferase
VADVVKVSAIVPVYNPGRYIDDCIRTLVGQSLPREEYEVIFVDDGSTDGTGERLDELAAEHPHVHVHHIPNSGWPGRPRNVGLDSARGDYVYFVDNDDWVGEEALERLHARALDTGADVVVGKVVGHGRHIPRAIFARNRDDVRLGWGPLLTMMTPHKLFRRELLVEHGIRYPEGKRRLEDHPFVIHAYLHANRIAILADYPCYHWAFRASGQNASARRVDPVGYFDNLREVLDLVEEHMEPGEERDALLTHWYRSKMLRSIGGHKLLRRHDADARFSREMHAQIERLARERYGPRFDRWLSHTLQLRSHLLLEGTYDQLVALARHDQQARARVRVQEIRKREDGLEVAMETHVHGPRFRRSEDRVWWVPPPGLEDAFEERHLDVTDQFERSRARGVVRSPDDESEYLLPSSSSVHLDGGDPRIESVARLLPAKAAGGGRLPEGRWELHAQVAVPGVAMEAPLEWRGIAPLVVRSAGSGSVEVLRTPLRFRLRHRFPRLARQARRVLR